MKKLLITTIALTAIGVAVRANCKNKMKTTKKYTNRILSMDGNTIAKRINISGL